MKKISSQLFKGIIILAFIPSQLMAQSASVTTENVASIEKPVTAATNASTTVLLSRLKEIKETNLSNLNRSEKKSLRKEVKEIKSELKATGNGVYLSVGAIIIIILLLILLL